MKRGTKASVCAVLGVTLAASLLGCAAQSSPSPAASLNPAQVQADYRAIAKASCSKAQTVGVVETDGNYRAVMVPKELGFQGYSAAYFEPPATYGLIWEADGLNACADWTTFSLAEEAGQPAAIKVSLSFADGSYTTAENIGDGKEIRHRMTISGGLIVGSQNLNDATAKEVSITYGKAPAADLGILTRAVTDYLKSQN